MAFEVESLARLKAVHASARERDVRILASLDHGSSISLMLADPEGNNVEVYWVTGRPADGMRAAPIDLGRPEAELRQQFEQ